MVTVSGRVIRMGVAMPSICDVRGCGAPAIRRLHTHLPFGECAYPPCRILQRPWRGSAIGWEVAHGEGRRPAIKLSGIGSKNSTFLSLSHSLTQRMMESIFEFTRRFGGVSDEILPLVTIDRLVANFSYSSRFNNSVNFQAGTRRAFRSPTQHRR